MIKATLYINGTESYNPMMVEAEFIDEGDVVSNARVWAERNVIVVRKEGHVTHIYPFPLLHHVEVKPVPIEEAAPPPPPRVMPPRGAD